MSNRPCAQPLATRDTLTRFDETTLRSDLNLPPPSKSNTKRGKTGPRPYSLPKGFASGATNPKPFTPTPLYEKYLNDPDLLKRRRMRELEKEADEADDSGAASWALWHAIRTKVLEGQSFPVFEKNQLGKRSSGESNHESSDVTSLNKKSRTLTPVGPQPGSSNQRTRNSTSQSSNNPNDDPAYQQREQAKLKLQQATAAYKALLLKQKDERTSLRSRSIQSFQQTGMALEDAVKLADLMIGDINLSPNEN